MSRPLCRPALADLGRIAVEQLEAHRLAHGSIRTYGTPRRLSVLVEGVVERQEDIAEEVKGPPADCIRRERRARPGRPKGSLPTKASASRNSS